MRIFKKNFVKFFLFFPLMTTPFVATSCKYLDELCERMHISFIDVKANIIPTKNNSGQNEYSFLSSTKSLNEKNPYLNNIYSSFPSKPGLIEFANNTFKILDIGEFKLINGSDEKNKLVYENARPIDFSDLTVNYEVTKIFNNIYFSAATDSGSDIIIPFDSFKFEDFANDINCKINIVFERTFDVDRTIITININYLFTLKDPKKTWKWLYTNYPISLNLEIKEQEKVTLIKQGINQKLITNNKNEITLIAHAYNDFIRGTNADVNNIGRFVQWLEGSTTIDSTNKETVINISELANKNFKKIFKDIFKCLKENVYQTNYSILPSDLTLEYLDLSTDSNVNTYPKKNIDFSLTKIEKASDVEMKMYVLFTKKNGDNWFGSFSEWLQDKKIEITIRCWLDGNNKGNINFN